MRTKGVCQTPKNWPLEIAYLAKPLYSRNLSQDIICALHSKPTDIEALSPVDGPSPNVIIRKIHSSAHPANGQYGLFTSKNLDPNSLILLYIGLVHGPDDADSSSDYDLSLDRDLNVGVDASSRGNEARFINDYRGISDTGPNAEFRDVFVRVGKDKFERRMAVYVLPAGKSGRRAAGIKKNEEILVSYGKGFWQERQAVDDSST